MIDKLYNTNGDVAVIVSGGYGAGWSTWCEHENRERAAFDPAIAQAILDKKTEEEIKTIASERYPKEYLGGLEERLHVEWIPKGTAFYIDEYDGSESIISNKNMTYTA